MASVVTWLDISADEQKRMRELASLFTLRDSRDELGLGLLRDSIADAVFPGTSTLHTRARYQLFVPRARDRRRQHTKTRRAPGPGRLSVRG